MLKEEHFKTPIIGQFPSIEKLGGKQSKDLKLHDSSWEAYSVVRHLGGDCVCSLRLKNI